MRATRDEIVDVLASVLKCPVAVVREDSTPASIPGWDSAKHVEIVLALEDRFGCTFDPDEIAELTSVARVQEALRRHGCR